MSRLICAAGLGSEVTVISDRQEPTQFRVENPAWHIHRYDESRDSFRAIYLTRTERRDATFLTDEYLGDRPFHALARPTGCRTHAPSHFVFHSAYCCSTLLANLLDCPGVASSLKEPQLLNDIVGWRHRRASPQRVEVLLDESLHLLGRRWSADEPVVIKPSNVCNGLIQPILTLRPESRAVLLYAALPAFLASIADKGLWGRRWVRDLLSKQITDGLVQLGFETREFFLMSDLQVAAVGWLVQDALFQKLAAAIPDRVMLLNSDDLIAETDQTLLRIGELFSIDGAALCNAAAGSLAKDAKTGEPVRQGQRRSAYDERRALHADEIDKVVEWSRAVFAARGMNISE